jgi:prolipoprotein diacylglyceryltransferase
MRPVFVAWLIRHGWPGWMAPDYATMVGLAGIVGAVLILRQAERDGARVDVQARALLLAYFAAMLGGYVFEWVRAVPQAIATRSIEPVVFAGRAAYGGLIFGLLCPVLYLRRRGATVVDFLDRATIAMGISFAAVRFGCFLEGCDFGRPTASWLGVRFPVGSPAADAHSLAHWVPPGSASLPVHPTELYESCLGLLASAIALVPLRRGRRDGSAFAAWLATYAVGRFLLELLRGDIERGRYGALSTAQWVSVVILVGLLFAIAQRRRAAMAVAACVFAVTLCLPRAALADEPPPPLPPASSPAPASAPAPASTQASAPAAAPAQPSEAPPEDPQKGRIFTVRATLVGSLTLARPDVPSGAAAELDAMFRVRLGSRFRIDMGAEGRTYGNDEATHNSLGLIGEAVIEVGRRFELTGTLVPHHTWINFKSDFFTDTNAYGIRYALGMQIILGRVALGFTPLAFNTTSSDIVGVISQWEPRTWVGVSF